MSVTKSLPHDAARLHVTGAARYIDDIPMPSGTLSLAFGLASDRAGRSPRWTSTPCAPRRAW